MSQASDYLEVEIRKHIFRTGSFTKPSVLSIALCTAAPVDADTGALTGKEVANAGSYARQSLNPLDANWTAASGTDGLTDNASAITFPTATASWGTVTHFAICDSATYGAGNMLIWGALTTAKTVGIGDIFKFNIGDLDVTVA
jgi:hypothetical protein